LGQKRPVKIDPAIQIAEQAKSFFNCVHGKSANQKPNDSMEDVKKEA
jgi:hypothetical protein